jgi:hypothetical protein
MDLRHTKPARRLAFEIKLDENRGFIARNPSIMSGFHGDYLRGSELRRATIPVSNIDSALRQEADVRMHAKICSHSRFYVG